MERSKRMKRAARVKLPGGVGRLAPLDLRWNPAGFGERVQARGDPAVRAFGAVSTYGGAVCGNAAGRRRGGRRENTRLKRRARGERPAEEVIR